MKLTILFMSLFLSSAFAATYDLDPKSSQLKWIGTKVTGSHKGTVEVKDGFIDYKNGQLRGGKVVVDMTEIDNDDLDGKWKKKLLNHLNSEDFFSTKNHKTSTFEIKNIKDHKEGVIVEGLLTIRGKTNQESLKMEVKEKDGVVTASGDLVFDRTKYNVRYNSGKFFNYLGDKLIHDEITLKINLAAKK